LPDGVELWAVRLPGRESRIAEQFVTDADEAVKHIFHEAKRLPRARTVFYGHSLGAGLAYQVVRLMSLERERLPALLIASGRLPPHRPYVGKGGRCEDQELLAHLTELGGIPPELMKSEAFTSTYLPRIRADFLMNETLPCGRFPALGLPITLINGVHDPLVESAALQEWRDYTDVAFKSFEIQGGHFCLQTHFEEFMGIVAGELGYLLSEASE
jgi:coronamic acid synthetase CmaT thioesterase component